MQAGRSWRTSQRTRTHHHWYFPHLFPCDAAFAIAAYLCGLPAYHHWYTDAGLVHQIVGAGGGEHEQQLSRLGSRPPFCERKCGGCAPCTAVQVRAPEGQLRPQCANYEPVGWKCKCGAAIFDP